MRKTLLGVWLLLPALAAVVFWYGPGRTWKELEDVSALIREADAHASRGEWAEAAEGYDLALQRLPAEKVDPIRRVRLAKSRARMFVGQLPQAAEDLDELLIEVTRDPKADPGLVEETRSAFANAQFYMTWLLRLYGLPESEWKPHIEAARQNYRLLAEGAEGRREPSIAQRMKEDLDSSIRLARMNLSDLQALPLPSQ